MILPQITEMASCRELSDSEASSINLTRSFYQINLYLISPSSHSSCQISSLKINSLTGQNVTGTWFFEMFTFLRGVIIRATAL